VLGRMESATAPQINVSGFTSFFYGYFFWLGRSLADKREVQWAAAVGLGGQRVLCRCSISWSWSMRASKSYEPRRLKKTIRQHSCQNAKVVEAF
jgi:hypothetical protein